MKAWLKRIQAWRSRRHQRREQRSLERWEQIRANGKARFVIRTVLTYGLVFVGASNAIEHLFYGPRPISLFKVIFYSLFGLGMGSSAWSDMESKYNKALNEARLKALPESNDSPASRV